MYAQASLKYVLFLRHCKIEQNIRLAAESPGGFLRFEQTFCSAKHRPLPSFLPFPFSNSRHQMAVMENFKHAFD